MHKSLAAALALAATADQFPSYFSDGRYHLPLKHYAPEVHEAVMAKAQAKRDRRAARNVRDAASMGLALVAA